MTLAVQARDVYAVDKLAAHPVTLRKLRETGEGDLITVHLMPCNICNQGCSFCSYRLEGNKNSATFNVKKYIEWDAMTALLDDFETMGVQGIEVTGGGEPLAYPYSDQLWTRLADGPFATSLVTNGTLLKDPALVSERLKWARVSIDAASSSTYATMRRAPAAHFDRAWKAVEALRKHAPKDPEYRLGVGFVLSNENTGEVHEACRLAREHGADNIRLSVTFSVRNRDYYTDHAAVEAAIEASKRAEADFSRDGFTVNNLMATRWAESLEPVQDYRRCPTKDVLCVVEGECKVFTCCTFTDSLDGCYGTFTEHPRGFKGLWQDFAGWRRNFNAAQSCKVACLYRERNMAMNALIDASELPESAECIHREFI